MGDTLVSIEGTDAMHVAIEKIRSGETSWSESFPIPDLSYLMQVEDLIVLTDQEVIIPILETSQMKSLFLLNVLTGEVKKLSEIGFRLHAFLITCVREMEGEYLLVSVVEMDDDYSNMMWEVVGTIPSNVWYDQPYHQRIVRVVEGMLTVLHAREGQVFYQEEGE